MHQDPKSPFFFHILVTHAAQQWISGWGAMQEAFADLMQCLEKSGLLIKSHRVNKSLDPEEFSYLPLRRALIFMLVHTHHHSPGRSVNLLLVAFPPGPTAMLL